MSKDKKAMKTETLWALFDKETGKLSSYIFYELRRHAKDHAWETDEPRKVIIKEVEK